MFWRSLLSMVLLAGMLFGQSVPRALAATHCDHAQFVSDLTVPDGASFVPGASFTKTWRFTNIGTCTWTTAYSVIFVGGDGMGSTVSVTLPVNVSPGQMLDISVNLTAPSAPGHYKSLWKFANASGAQFGIGDSASDAFWVDINVVATTAVIYDFVVNAQYAQWKSGAGPLPFPGTSGDSRGFSYVVDNPHLEDDSFDSTAGLLTVPQNKYNGYIQATYPEFQIQQGDRLQTLVNCEFGATGCYVTFRIDYLLPNGAQKTLWTWKEAYDKRFHRANLDLSPLAGQRVRFVFMLLSTGSASGDRAIWGSPRILRSGSTQPPSPPATLTPLPPLTPTATPIMPPPPTIAPSGCDKASFIADITVPDGTSFSPGAAFTKTWRLKNSGLCTWTTAYKLMYYSGEQMGAPTAVNLPWTVYPGQTVDISVNMVAPNSAGQYRGFWILANANGTMFGIGTSASNPIWVEIKVAGGTPTEMGYDFWQNACSAQWKSGAGALPCPGTAGDRNGFVIADGFSHLEDGTMGPAPSLLMSPENKYNGYIQGFYPAFTVQPGDRFRTVVGCEFGYSCYVTFRLDYMTANGYIGTFWTWREQNDKKNYMADVDLSPLAGRSIRFILTILATGSATGDRVRWGGPYIVRAGGAPSPATPTPIPPMSDWLTFTNSTYGYLFQYPPQSQVFNQFPESLLMSLPITPGTNLIEKYLDQRVLHNVEVCAHPQVGVTSGRETVIINGINFFKDTGGDSGAGHLRKWTAYSTTRDNLCVTSLFVLHSGNPDTYDPPRPVYNEAAESAVFLQMMSTFTFLAAPPTPTFTPVPPTLTPVSPPTNTPEAPIYAPTISSLHMLDSTNGWAISDRYVLRTNNGGASWSVALFESFALGGYFASPTKAWVLSRYAETGEGSLYYTMDGGSNWTRYDVPFKGGYIQFLDDRNGFVLSGEPSGMQKHPVSLYQTSDGGATWTLKYTNILTAPNPGTSLPFSGHKNGMSFRDTTTGWVGGDYPTNGYVYLYKTTDSGVTWSQVSLPLPAGYQSAFITTTAPKFFGLKDAVLPVWMTLGAGMRDLFLYTTRDGGNTWTPSAGFARNAEHTAIISMNNTISWDWSNKFHATGNSGASWTTITPNFNFGENFRGLDFISATTGWARHQTPDGLTALYRTSDGGYTWTLVSGYQPVPPTATPLPPPTATPSTQIRPYAVIRVAQDDVLNIRSGAGVSHPVVGSFAWDAIDVMRTGPTSSVDGSVWVEVQNPGGGTGWVNFFYLTEYVSRDAFCADARIAPMIEQLRQSVNQSNGDLFSALVSPQNGVDVHLWAYQPAVNFTQTTARNVFTSSQAYNWGSGPRGEPDLGTFKDIIQPRMLDTLNAPNLETYCDNLMKVYPLANPWPETNIRYYNLYKPASGEIFDFRTWLIGFEYINNQPYLYRMVNIVWEP
jgi:photosystem II stability/assembly factor-like uncharacterized protein